MTRSPVPFGVWALAATNFAIGTQSLAFSGLLSPMARDLGVSEAAVGALVTLTSITFAIIAPLTASLIMRLERRRVLVVAMISLAGVNLVCAIAPSYAPLAVLRIAAGVVTGLTGSVASVAAAALVPPRDQGRAFAAVLSGLTASFLLGVPLASVIGATTGWRGSFALSAGIALLVAALLVASLPRLPGSVPMHGTVRHALRNRTILGLYATIFGAFGATFTVVAFLGPLITGTTGLSGAGIGALQACIGIGSVVGLAVGGRIDPAEGDRATRLLTATIAATMLGYLAVAGLPSGLTIALPLAALILTGAASLFALVPLTMSRLATEAGTAAPVVLALNGSVISLGQGFGAGLGGLSMQSLGFMGLALAGLAVATLVLLVNLRGGHR